MLPKPAFECAKYKDGTKEYYVYCKDITPDSYKNKYRGHLRCPNKECQAEIFYVSPSTTGTRAFFRCERLDKHAPGCMYKKYRARMTVDISVRDIPRYFDEGRIQDTLSTQFRKHFIYKGKIPKPGTPGKHTRITTRYNIKYYSAFDIHGAIIRKIAIVGGYVRNLDRHNYREDNKHAYVNLIGAEDVIGVLLSEKRDDYPGEAKALIDKIDEMVNKPHAGLSVACVAFGEVAFARNGNGIRIRLASLKHIICKYIPDVHVL